MVVGYALKEWDVICRALAAGRHRVLLRKGGIHEGPGGFRLEHPLFALLPTLLHQDASMVRAEHRDLVVLGEAEPAAFVLTHAVAVRGVEVVASREALDALDPSWHVWTGRYFDLRWNYRPERPLYLAHVEACALASPRVVRNTWEVAGCRSWVPLDPPAKVADAEASLG